MEAHRKRLGAQLLELRKARGWSQEDAAHEIGVGVKTWRLWERAKTLPYDSNIRKLAEVFEVDPDYFGQIRPAPLGLEAVGQAPPFDLTALIQDTLESAITGVLAEVIQQLAIQTTALGDITAAVDALKHEVAELRRARAELKSESDELAPLVRAVLQGQEAEAAPPAAPKRSPRAKT